MIDPRTRIVQYSDAVNGEDIIKGRIVKVGCLASYHTGILDPDNIYYEKPQLSLDIDSEIGVFQILFDLERDDSNFLQQIFDYQNADVRDLINNTIYIAPDDGFNRASISDSIPIRYSRESSHVVYEKDNMKDVAGINGGNYRKMPIERMNYIINLELKRKIQDNYGWIKTKVEIEQENNCIVFKAVDVSNNNHTVSWSFESGIGGIPDFNNFVDKTNMLLDEDKSEFWIKPVRSVHFSNRPSSSALISDGDVWIATDRPKTPEQNNSLKDRILGYLPSFSNRVEAEIGRNKNNWRNARIIDEYENYNSNYVYTKDIQKQKI